MLAAARAVKAKVPGVTPLWIAAGTSAGPTGVLQGSGALVYTSSTPVIYDTKTGKYVTDSAGLREVFQFYKDVYSAGLGAPLSDLFSPKAVAVPVSLMAQQKLAIAIGSNWYGGAWKLKNRYWADAATQADAVALPTSHGQPPGQGGTIGGWDVAIAKASKQPESRMGFDRVDPEAELHGVPRQQGRVRAARHGGCQVARLRQLRATLQRRVCHVSALSEICFPRTAGFAVWARGIEEATGKIAQDPNTSVAAALKTLHDTVADQLGPNEVETLQ